jgi:hypothetical protein
MSESLSAREAACRLLAVAWEPEGLPPAEAIPWPEVLRLVDQRRLAGLLHLHTARLRHSLPLDVRQTLEEAHYRAITLNVRYLDQLAGVRAALSGVDAPVMLIKGAALVETLYDNMVPRLSEDIDLVVPLTAMPACRQVLLDLGYRPVEVEVRPGAQEVHRSQEGFLPPDPLQAPVSLHWQVLDVPYYRHSVPMQWFWQNSETLSIAGQPFQVLNDLANLVYLPAHLALHHGFWQLHSLFDLALLVVRTEGKVDWGAIAATARSFDLLTALRETVERLADCWPGLPIAEPRRELAALAPSRADERIFRLLTSESRSPSLNIYTTLVTLPDMRARARFLWDNVFPQPAYMVDRYGIRARWTLPYWYLYRFLTGLAQFARKLPRARQIERPRS